MIEGGDEKSYQLRIAKEKGTKTIMQVVVIDGIMNDDCDL